VTTLTKIAELYSHLTEADQLSLLTDLIQSHRALARSDRWWDAMAPVDAAFSAAYDELSAIASGWEPLDGSANSRWAA
jgi:hypothetical protein